MRKSRIFLICLTLAVLGTWGALFSRLRAEYTDRSLLDLEPRITATGEAVFDNEWFGIYIGGAKVGWHHYILEEGDPRAGEKLVAKSESRLVFSILGTTQLISLENTVAMDRDLHPLSFRSILVSPIQRMTVQGKRHGDVVKIHVSSGKTSHDTEIPLPGENDPPLVLQETLRAHLVAQGLEPGKELRYTLFDPVLQMVAPLEVKIRNRETIRTAGGPVEALPVTIEFQGLEMRWWLAEDGTTLRGESLLGGTRFREEKESREAALAGIGKTHVDLVANSRIKPAGIPIPDDRFITSLRIRLTGLDPERFPSLGGTRIDETEGSVILRLHSGKISLEKQPTEQEIAPYLVSTLSITADDPGIVALAKELAEGVREESASPAADQPPPSGRYARAVFDWVRREIHREIVIGFPTAAEVLKTRRGDCNEHTALVAALCRAAGIPCKAVAGVVYLNGAFYYHAWNEVYLDKASGGPAWLPVDAALGQWPADATHIKFVEGDPAEQTAIMTLFGNLEIEILSVGGGSS